MYCLIIEFSSKKMELLYMPISEVDENHILKVFVRSIFSINYNFYCILPVKREVGQV